MLNPKRTLSLAIMSGKGGVGKTNVALNLGYALKNSGHTALLMDCDLGLANLDVLLGISPEKNMQDMLRGETAPRDVVVPIEESGLDILPAASGVPELVELDEDLRALLVKKLTDLVGTYDYLILDLGAGINETVLSFATAAQMRVVVVTPEPTSLTDGYALIKVLLNQHGVREFWIAVNQASDPREAKETFKRLADACKNFLGLTVFPLGHVRSDPAMIDAVRLQTPLLKHRPDSKAAKDIASLAEKIQRFRDDNLGLLSDTPVLRNFPNV